MLKSVTALPVRSAISSICCDFLFEKFLKQSQFTGCQHLVWLSALMQHITLLHTFTHIYASQHTVLTQPTYFSGTKTQECFQSFPGCIISVDSLILLLLVAKTTFNETDFLTVTEFVTYKYKTRLILSCSDFEQCFLYKWLIKIMKCNTQNTIQ